MIEIGTLVQFKDAVPEEFSDMWHGIVLAMTPTGQTATVYWSESLVWDHDIDDISEVLVQKSSNCSII